MESVIETNGGYAVQTSEKGAERSSSMTYCSLYIDSQFRKRTMKL
jgi:hypothetical protein